MIPIEQQEAPYPFTPARLQGRICDKEDFCVIATLDNGDRARCRLWWIREKARDNKLLLEYLNFLLPFSDLKGRKIVSAEMEEKEQPN